MLIPTHTFWRWGNETTNPVSSVPEAWAINQPQHELCSLLHLCAPAVRHRAVPECHLGDVIVECMGTWGLLVGWYMGLSDSIMLRAGLQLQSQMSH